MTKKGLTISVCESCTGGLLGSVITATPGSSRYFRGGIIAYDNNIKTRLVGVSPKSLKRYGAVSRPVAREMASHIAHKFKTDIGIGITGIAGPGGGTVKKPVGLVYTAVLYRKRIVIEKSLFRGTRNTIRKKAVKNALSILKNLING